MGLLPVQSYLGLYVIELPYRITGCCSVIQEACSNINDILLSSDVTNKAILASTNENCLSINNVIIVKKPGFCEVYNSFGTCC